MPIFQPDDIKTDERVSTNNHASGSTPVASPSTTAKQQLYPLSWHEARTRMSHLLRWYLISEKSSSGSSLRPRSNSSLEMVNPFESVEHNDDDDDDDDDSKSGVDDIDTDSADDDGLLETNSRWKRIASKWLYYDMDLYCGSLFFSGAMVVISIVLFQRVSSDDDAGGGGNSSDGQRHTDMVNCHRYQLVGAIMLLVGSMTSAWIIRRRRYVGENDGDTKKRNAVCALLRVIDKLLAQGDYGNEDGDGDIVGYGACDDDHFDGNGGGEGAAPNNSTKTHNVLGMGNPLGDIYSVYRLSCSVDRRAVEKTGAYTDTNGGNYTPTVARWHRIPSLLLVEGDFIALQNGDKAPCNIVLLDTKTTNSINSYTPTRDIIKAGETIQPLPSELKSRPPNVCHPSFPPGRSCLSPNDSKKALHLCRNVKVFVVKKAPLVRFLTRRRASSQAPQLHRKMAKIRSSLNLLGIAMFLVVTALILIRHRAGDGAPHLYSLWHLPFLAVLGVLPVTTPIVLFLSEIVGASRILASAHPYVYNTTESGRSVEDDGMSGAGAGSGGDWGDVDMHSSQGGSLSSSVSSSSLLLQGSERKYPRVLVLRYILHGIQSRLWSRAVLGHSKCSEYSEYSGNDDNENIGERDTSCLIDFPPTSSCLFERMGVVTALALVDDELVCDPASTPQQLLIPSSNGLKLLDLFPKFDDDTTNESSTYNQVGGDNSSDSDDDYGDNRREDVGDHIKAGTGSTKRLNLVANLRRRYLAMNKESARDGAAKKFTSQSSQCDDYKQAAQNDYEVQFEDPNWWHHLPSLKCIGLGCLLVNDVHSNDDAGGSHDATYFTSTTATPAISSPHQQRNRHPSTNTTTAKKYALDNIETALAHHIRQINPRKKHLDSLSSCIGFNTEPNAFGPRGDITPFQERRRLHIVATRLLHQRMQLDRHAISIEESRAWGILSPDSTSVLVKDTRSKTTPSSSSHPTTAAKVPANANIKSKNSNTSGNNNTTSSSNSNNNNANYQLLTLGDTRVVLDFCSDAWQGENSTITPLGMKDRLAILESQKNWSLADLEVTAFSYAPIPTAHELRLFETRTADNGGGLGAHHLPKTTYLVDNKTSGDPSIFTSITQKENSGDDWSLMRNQIFLGLLGSSVSPRKEIAWVTDVCNEAGIRFVYFSPRNMRRTKELASQMGIEVSWNCAISLRPLDEGEETDEHRMTSNYADWDVNARLPHGVADVQRHLKKVDNVPLLVSIFTDVTKHTTAKMVHVFQNYRDTVLAIGLSHVSCNDEIFSNSDLSIGISLSEENSNDKADDSRLTSYKDKRYYQNDLDPAEMEYSCSIAAHSCVFIVSLRRGLRHLSDILSQARGALNAATSAGLFVITSYLSFSFLILLSTCSASTVIPFVPPIGSALFLQLIVPLIGLSMSFTDSNKEVMRNVPPKNDKSITFSEGEQRRLYIYAVLRAIPIAVFPQLIYLIALGCLMMRLEQDFLINEGCSRDQLFMVVRCKALKRYSGTVFTSSGSIMLAEFALCIIVLSSTFVFRLTHIRTIRPWKMNRIWIVTTIISIGLVLTYLAFTLDRKTLVALPWYFYILVLSFPLICAMVSEAVKTQDMQNEKGADNLRRLQFETRLGMWSPK